MSSPSKKQKMCQNKAKYFAKTNRKQYMEPGQRGFLATCNFREKDCVREAYNILNSYADELYGPASQEEQVDVKAEDTTQETGDITDDLQKEIAAAKNVKPKDKSTSAKQQRFQVVDTGANNCVFIRTNLNEPSELGYRIAHDIATTGKQKTRFLLRLVPVELVCRIADISNVAGTLFDKHFLKESCTFSIVFNRRYNNNVKRDDIIHELANLVQSKNIGNRVNLKQAKKTVVVEVIKGLCCIGVVEDYLLYKKYNLVELANTKENEVNKAEDENTEPVEDKPQVKAVEANTNHPTDGEIVDGT